eukprot:7677994-Alexandrium_andersonii.AAC.1
MPDGDAFASTFARAVASIRAWARRILMRLVSGFAHTACRVATTKPRSSGTKCSSTRRSASTPGIFPQPSS